jgi:hypothetical protein
MRLQECCLELTGAEPTPAIERARSLRTELAARLDEDCGQTLSISLPVTIPAVPDANGDHPLPNHPHPGSETGLRPIDSYGDVFTYVNTAERMQSPTPAAEPHAAATAGDRPSTATGATDTDPRTLYYHCYLHTDGETEGCLPVPEAWLTGLDVAGAQVTAAVTQTVDCDTLDYARLTAADTHRIELLSPFVHHSTEREFAGSPLVAWVPGRAPLRWESMAVPIDGTVHELETLVAGQQFRYDGDDPRATAMAGIRGIGHYAELGLGAVRIRPANRRPLTDAPR